MINDGPFCFSPSLTRSLPPAVLQLLPSETPQASSAIPLPISPKDLQAGSIHQQEPRRNLDSASARTHLIRVATAFGKTAVTTDGTL